MGKGPLRDFSKNPKTDDKDDDRIRCWWYRNGVMTDRLSSACGAVIGLPGRGCHRLGKIYDDDQRKEGQEPRRSDAWIFDPTQPDGKPRPVLNTPEELAKIHEVLDRHFGVWNEKAPDRKGATIARVALMPIEILEPAIPEGETVTESEAVEMLKAAVEEAGGQRQLAAKFGQGNALISKALGGKRKMGITVLAMIGLRPDQVVPDAQVKGEV